MRLKFNGFDDLTVAQIRVARRRARVAKLRSKGLSLSEVARRLGCSVPTVVRDQRSIRTSPLVLGIPPAPPGRSPAADAANPWPLTDADRRAFKDAVALGISPREIAEIFGLDLKVVTVLLVDDRLSVPAAKGDSDTAVPQV